MTGKRNIDKKRNNKKERETMKKRKKWDKIIIEGRE